MIITAIIILGLIAFGSAQVAANKDKGGTMAAVAIAAIVCLTCIVMASILL
jgi:hypothetical protein